jgi:hypothetical protein
MPKEDHPFILDGAGCVSPFTHLHGKSPWRGSIPCSHIVKDSPWKLLTGLAGLGASAPSSVVASAPAAPTISSVDICVARVRFVGQSYLHKIMVLSGRKKRME